MSAVSHLQLTAFPSWFSEVHHGILGSEQPRHVVADLCVCVCVCVRVHVCCPIPCRLHQGPAILCEHTGGETVPGLERDFDRSLDSILLQSRCG